MSPVFGEVGLGLELTLGAGKMAQWVKALAAKPDKPEFGSQGCT